MVPSGSRSKRPTSSPRAPSRSLTISASTVGRPLRRAAADPVDGSGDILDEQVGEGDLGPVGDADAWLDGDAVGTVGKDLDVADGVREEQAELVVAAGLTAARRADNRRPSGSRPAK
jgi:hypothetical protein